MYGMMNMDEMISNNIGIKRNHFYLKITLFLLSGSIMIGHGLRMIYQGLFRPDSYYFPNTFDLFFDWLSLFALGCFVLWFAISQFYALYKKSYNKESSSKNKNIIMPT